MRICVEVYDAEKSERIHGVTLSTICSVDVKINKHLSVFSFAFVIPKCKNKIK